MSADWLIMKRGLFYRPDACGYTGIRDNAGRYSLDEARKHESPDHGVSIVLLADAPEFAPSCFEDLKVKHLQAKIERLETELAAYRSADLRHPGPTA